MRVHWEEVAYYEILAADVSNKAGKWKVKRACAVGGLACLKQALPSSRLVSPGLPVFRRCTGILKPSKRRINLVMPTLCPLVYQPIQNPTFTLIVGCSSNDCYALPKPFGNGGEHVGIGRVGRCIPLLLCGRLSIAWGQVRLFL